MDVSSIPAVTASQACEEVTVDFDLASLAERVPPLIPDAISKSPKRMHLPISDELEQLHEANAKRMQVQYEPPPSKATLTTNPASPVDAQVANTQKYEEAVKAMLLKQEQQRKERYRS